MEWVGVSLALEESVFVDVFDLESGDCVSELFGEFGWAAAKYLLFDYSLLDAHPGVLLLAIDVSGVQGVPDEPFP